MCGECVRVRACVVKFLNLKLLLKASFFFTLTLTTKQLK